MKLLSILFILFFILVNSCQKQKNSVSTQSTLQDSIQKDDKKNIFGIGISLNKSSKKAVKNWKEYKLIDIMLTRYFAISNSEALSNAKELSDLATHLKDSIRDEKLNIPSVKARLNILHNECMRLNDMASIPAISPKEVSSEIQKILEAFSVLNAKLNSVYTVNELETELELDPDFLTILNDSLNTSKTNSYNSTKLPVEKRGKKPKKRILNTPLLKSVKDK